MDSKTLISLLILSFMGNLPGKKIQFIFLCTTILLQCGLATQNVFKVCQTSILTLSLR